VEINPSTLTNSTFELVNWLSTPSDKSLSSYSLSDKVLAIQTTRFSPQSSVTPDPYTQAELGESLITDRKNNEKSPYDAFNLGLHVGDSVENVTNNRNLLKQYIYQQLTKQDDMSVDEVKVQWLNQVHGNEVVEVSVVNEQAITADASITRQKNVALAIMTADCLPILLSHKDGSEIAAIHGGWRPLAANIISITLEKMQSNNVDIIAWLGPCISHKSFEVGAEVKEEFTKQNMAFSSAFLKQENGKYLADLQKIARLQLQLMGITEISSLAECTYQEATKYYSYRKEQITGRMVSVICKR